MSDPALDDLVWQSFDGRTGPVYDRALGPLDAKACYGGDRQEYRYLVTYRWSANPATLTWIMLNPSTATERRLDPTLRRCMNYGVRWGYGGMTILNLYAYRSTDPRALSRVTDPVGPANDIIIRRHIQIETRQEPDHLIVCGWGGNGPRRSNRPRYVWDLIRHHGGNPHVLATGSLGFPKHPLYLKNTLTPYVPASPPPTRTDLQLMEGRTAE